jgi:hypothetical protein
LFFYNLISSTSSFFLIGNFLIGQLSIDLMSENSFFTISNIIRILLIALTILDFILGIVFMIMSIVSYNSCPLAALFIIVYESIFTFSRAFAFLLLVVPFCIKNQRHLQIYNISSIVYNVLQVILTIAFLIWGVITMWFAYSCVSSATANSWSKYNYYSTAIIVFFGLVNMCSNISHVVQKVGSISFEKKETATSDYQSMNN